MVFCDVFLLQSSVKRCITNHNDNLSFYYTRRNRNNALNILGTLIKTLKILGICSDSGRIYRQKRQYCPHFISLWMITPKTEIQIFDTISKYKYQEGLLFLSDAFPAAFCRVAGQPQKKVGFINTKIFHHLFYHVLSRLKSPFRK